MSYIEKHFCSCGAQMIGKYNGPKDEDAQIKDIMDEFRSIHSGPGHEETTAARCHAARRRAEKEGLK